jgi:hypothetical protein
MVEKASGRKPKAKATASGVLGTLPASRPERIGGPRVGAAKPAARATNGEKPRAAKRPAKAPKPRANGAPRGPQAVRPGSSALRAKRPAEPPPKPLGAPRGTELVTTTVRAAGELAHIGFTVGGQALKRVVRRLPRP